MIDTARLRGEIARNGLTGADLAKIIGITPKTFYAKMRRGVFGSDEIETMINALEIQRPMDIFFVKK